VARKESGQGRKWTVEVLRFRTSGSWPYLKTLVLLMFTFSVCFFLIMMGLTNPLGLLIVLVVLGAITLVFGISPAVTEHHIGGKALVLRHGWYFQATVPLSNVRDVDETEEGIPGHGVNFLLGGSRLYLANSRVGLVKIKLHDRQMIGGLFGRSITEIVTNVDEPTPFIRALRERAGLKVKIDLSAGERKDKCPHCGQIVPGGLGSAGPADEAHKEAVPMIECIFLVHNDGRLIQTYKSGRVQTKEAFSVMGMLTAIQDFVKDAFKRTDGALRTLEHGDLKVLLERGSNIYLAVVIEGGTEPPELRKAMRRSIKEVEAKFGKVLDEHWDGEITDLGDLKKILSQLLWT